MINEILKKLERFNDPLFKFEPIKHRYTYNGDVLESVTRYISKFHVKFDSDFHSEKKAKEIGISKEEVLLEWKRINDRANEIGTATHNWIENYYNGIYQKLPNDIDVIDRINKFNLAYAKWLHRLTPIKFEQRVFSKDLKIAGTFDALFLTTNNDIVILDYKTNKEFTHDEHENGKFKKMLFPFEDQWHNKLNEYSIQVSLYKKILSEVDIDVKDCYLLYIGPNNPAKLFKAKDFTNRFSKINF